MIKNVLTIAGSDPSGGAGIQADLKTFTVIGAYGMAAMTSLTAQNTKNVAAIHNVPAAFVKQQLEAIFEDIRVDAVKIGMAGSVETITVIAEILSRHKPKWIVLDPVMVSTSGHQLISDESITALKNKLVPLASLITPNIPEGKILGAVNIPTLLKGGHEKGKTATDILLQGDQRTEFSTPRIDTKNTHGTGCTLSAAITVFLSQGHGLKTATQKAKDFLTGALENADKLDIGNGHGPVNHLWKFKDE